MKAALEAAEEAGEAAALAVDGILGFRRRLTAETNLEEATFDRRKAFKIKIWMKDLRRLWPAFHRPAPLADLGSWS